MSERSNEPETTIIIGKRRDHWRPKERSYLGGECSAQREVEDGRIHVGEGEEMKERNPSPKHADGSGVAERSHPTG